MRRAASAATLALACGSASAHGFGQRYDLPIPLALYTCGAALTIVISCLMFALYARAPRDDGYPRWNLLATAIGRLLASPPVVAGIRLAAVAVFVFMLFAGFFGNQNPFRNVVPVTVWALWWVGMAYVSALVGDLWKVANPLETIFAVFERWRAGRALSLGLALPQWIQAWPAVVLYLGFLWLEIAWPGSDSP